MGVLIWGRGNQDLTETKNETKNLSKIVHVMYLVSQ